MPTSYTSFSAQPTNNNWFLLFNIFFSSLLVIALRFFDQDVSDRYSYKFMFLYQGVQNLLCILKRIDNGLKFLENAFLVKKQIGLKFKNIKTNMKEKAVLVENEIGLKFKNIKFEVKGEEYPCPSLPALPDTKASSNSDLDMAPNHEYQVSVNSPTLLNDSTGEVSKGPCWSHLL
ncbi:transmembrane protein [Arabidopsis thaliana]|uniref:Transmembrane protein n=1 Tax=Arabidopsis thaliana TaxID=3702 RepID=F4J8U4_ARATH|nr:uncharacterized protein AT3G18700 [Arabidopsis thaliana]AEE76133.1 transmembrane protein [Arabidopsis thaliana]|eukprot:NP_188500.2 transmembrane protein [Arabidopsis thaliana]